MTGFGHFPSIADLSIADLEYLAAEHARVAAERRTVQRQRTRQARVHTLRWLTPWPRAAITDPARPRKGGA